jgi:tetratricopeptide (TPR) repeat protein
MGRAHTVAGDFPAALGMLQKGIALAEKLRDSELLSASLAFLGQTYFMLGRSEDGWGRALHALALSEARINPSRLAADLAVVGWGLAFAGQFERATDYLQRCLRIAQDNRLDLPLITASGALGYIALQRKDYGSALELLDTALHHGEAQQILFHLPLYRVYRAELDLVHHYVDGAQRGAEAALKMAEATQQDTACAEYYVLAGKIHAAAGEWQKAEKSLTQGIEAHLKYERIPFAASVLFTQAKMRLSQKDTEGGRAPLERALKLFRQSGMLTQFEEARTLQDTVYNSRV